MSRKLISVPLVVAITQMASLGARAGDAVGAVSQCTWEAREMFDDASYGGIACSLVQTSADARAVVKCLWDIHDTIDNDAMRAEACKRIPLAAAPTSTPSHPAATSDTANPFLGRSLYDAELDTSDSRSAPANYTIALCSSPLVDASGTVLDLEQIVTWLKLASDGWSERTGSGRWPEVTAMGGPTGFYHFAHCTKEREPSVAWSMTFGTPVFHSNGKMAWSGLANTPCYDTNGIMVASSCSAATVTLPIFPNGVTCRSDGSSSKHSNGASLTVGTRSMSLSLCGNTYSTFVNGSKSEH